MLPPFEIGRFAINGYISTSNQIPLSPRLPARVYSRGEKNRPKFRATRITLVGNKSLETEMVATIPCFKNDGIGLVYLLVSSTHPRFLTTDRVMNSIKYVSPEPANSIRR